jgi:biopolymer transport protein ExbB/TolQ
MGVVMDYFSIIGMVVIVTIFFFYLTKLDNQKMQAESSGVLITTGIFFTFIGIAYGLYNFDVDNVDKSLPMLLTGIKSAFWASASGVGAALILKMAYSYHENSITASEKTEGATIDDLIELIKNQTKTIKQSQETNQQILKSIAGSEDSSLVAQLKLLRVDANEKSDALRREFKEFAKTMAENNTKAFIQALEEVIRDFNTKLSEQFGENFKQLNEAVGRTVDWQENYRTQMQDSIELMDKISASLQKQVQDYSIVLDKSEHFANHANDMSKILDAIEKQKNHVDEAIKALHGMVEKTTIELPKLGEQTTKMITEISNSSNTLIENINENNAKTMQTLENTTRNIEEQVKALDTALENELTNSLKTLGQQLASLSEKFVADYSPLTDKLRELIQLSKRV